MSIMNLGNASASAERLIRAYHSHCVAPDLDSLFGFLEAAHSTNDRLKKAVGIEFLDIPEFLALKCLRNFFHHHDELRHEVRIVPTLGLPVQTDLLFLCLAHRELVDDPEVDVFRESYDFETESAHSHLVDGRISTLVGGIEPLLLEMMA